MGVFIMVVPPNHPFIDWIFHEINHPAIGEPHFRKPPYHPLAHRAHYRKIGPQFPATAADEPELSRGVNTPWGYNILKLKTIRL